MAKINISIITGLGPIASQHFVRAIRNSVANIARDVHIEEHYVSAETVIPILSDTGQIAKLLLNAIGRRRVCDRDLILVPCNSVHGASALLKQACGDRFLPIDQAVLDLIRRENRRGRFLVLGTGATVASGMYQDVLTNQGLAGIALPKDAQQALDRFIFERLVKGQMVASHLHAFRVFAERHMAELDADHVILACTELCYLVQAFSRNLAHEVDSLRALHDATLERIRLRLESGVHHAF